MALGLSMNEEVLVAQELGYTSPAFRSAFGTNVGISSQGIFLDGTEEQKKYYLPKLATGELASSFALTEPDAGSDAGAVSTSAQLDGDHYVINGTKRFITNAPRAGIFTLMARTGGVPGRGFITAMKVLDRDWLHISAVSLATARRLIDESLGYSIYRKQFGQHIADFQLIQAMLAYSETEYYAGKCMTEVTARH